MMIAYDLQRFVQAQEAVYPTVLEELRGGRKRSHWIWFIFPQIQGLGSSPMAQLYAIDGLGEASAYLAHDLLRQRLQECTQAVLDIREKSAHDVLGSPDDMKFRSSMTLFAEAVGGPCLFVRALEKYYNGVRDPLTLERLNTGNP